MREGEVAADDDELTGLSLCTGGGGLERGVELALGDVHWLAYVEREAFALGVMAEALDDALKAEEDAK